MSTNDSSGILTAEPAAVATPRAAPGNPAMIPIKIMASLRLTVFLMLLAMGLVFFGTLAQVHNGVWTIVDKYFRFWVVWVPAQIFFHPTFKIPSWLGFPYPGGWTIGVLLLLNLTAAHLMRFQVRWSKVGMWLIHSGLVIMLLGELATGLFATESRMVIEEGKSSDFVIDHRKLELAIIDVTDPEIDKVVAIPEAMIRKGKRVSPGDLPVDVQGVAFYTNSAMLDGRPDPASNLATKGFGLTHKVEKRAEVSGTDPDQAEDVASTYVRLIDRKSGEELGVWLVSMHLKDQLITIGEKKYELTLRYKRTYEPYTYHLAKFTHDKYVGTEVAKDYRAKIWMVDPGQNVDREVDIYMNAPMYHRGKTYYQSGFLPPGSGVRGTILQVVHNPGWFMPYLSCILVALGMLIHFGMALGRFLRRSYREQGVVA